MFDAVRNNKMFAQAILGLIAITFAFFGVESYMNNSGSANEVAKVGDTKIDLQQFQQAVREQQERMRDQLGTQFDPKMLDTPEGRKAILDDLINRRLLLLEANKRRLAVGDEAIRRTVLGIEAFQVDGKFSNERYEAALATQGRTPTGFEAQLRQDIVLQLLLGTLARSNISAQTVFDRILALQTEKREVSEVRIAFDAYLNKVTLADDAAKKYYDENSQQFLSPEQALVEYVMLVDQPEERRASHILIASEKLGADQARAKAEEVLAEARKNPGRFAELARKYSDDPGSASKGGDLDFFGRGMMTKPFEDAVFALGEGEISGLVQSEFGFHIIKLTGIHAAKFSPQAEMKQGTAARSFAEAAEKFSNTVYEEADSLTPAADMFKLKVVRSGWLGRQGDPANGPLANEKLLAALFSEDSIKTRRNTEVVEIAPNTLVAARLVEYKPATLLPFEGLQASIETLLRRQEAQAMAVKDGEARLEALKNGGDESSWSAAKVVSRMDSRQIPPMAVAAVFRMDADKLPAYAGVALPGIGYGLYRRNRVEAGATIEAASRQAAQGQLANLAAEEELRLYLAALRARYKVEVNQSALESR